MYRGKALEGRYFLAMCDITREPLDFCCVQYHMKGDTEHWRERLAGAFKWLFDKHNTELPESAYDEDNIENILVVHYAMKHRAKNRGFIITHSVDECIRAAEKDFNRLRKQRRRSV